MNITRSFYFIRHGQTDWNKEERLQGSTDIPLNETGIEQAQHAAENCKGLPIDVIIASPLERAYKTAEIINEEFNVEIIEDDRLAEKNYGMFEGRLISERKEWAEQVKAETPDVELESNGFPVVEDAEPYSDFEYRICEAVNEYLEKFEGKNVMLVAHAGLFRSFLHAITGERYPKNGIKPKNAKPFLFEKSGDKWEIKEV